MDIFTALMSWLGTADYGALDTLLHKETADLGVSSMMFDDATLNLLLPNLGC